MMSLNSDNSLSLDNVLGLSDLNDAQAETIQGGRRRRRPAKQNVFGLPLIETVGADGQPVFFVNNRGVR